jgi:hypothetical protein
MTTRLSMTAVTCLLTAVVLMAPSRNAHERHVLVETDEVTMTPRSSTSREPHVRPTEPLSGLVEPLTFTAVGYFDDGGSKGLEFKDANQRIFNVCWLADEYGENLILGRFSPLHTGRELRRFRVGGEGDQAFLRLLERWYHGDPEAQLMARLLEEASPRGTSDQVSAKAKHQPVSTDDHAKFTAVRLLHKLRLRCSRKHD